MRDKSFEELHELVSFDFDDLLEPYREGGTKTKPVRRSMGTILDYLLNKKKYPVDVVGGALVQTIVEMRNGLKFLGDGATLGKGQKMFHKPGGYGAPGRELVSYLRLSCDTLLKQKHESDMGIFAARIIEAAKAKRKLRDKWRNWMKTGRWI